jgi:SAM-dependent methyltransferase
MDGRSAETGERVGTEAPAPQHELTDPAGRRVLEVGAGGANYRLLALSRWAGAHVTGVDYSGVGLEVLTRIFRMNGADVEVVRGDFLHVVLPRTDFHLVVHGGFSTTSPTPFRSCVPAPRSFDPAACIRGASPAGHEREAERARRFRPTWR